MWTATCIVPTSWGPLAGGNTYPDPNPNISPTVATAEAGAHTDRAGPQDPVPLYSPMAPQDLTSTHPAAANAGIANPNSGGHAGQQTAGGAEILRIRPELSLTLSCLWLWRAGGPPSRRRDPLGGAWRPARGATLTAAATRTFASSFVTTDQQRILKQLCECWQPVYA